jgi:Tfp pilus assembly protein PilE
VIGVAVVVAILAGGGLPGYLLIWTLRQTYGEEASRNAFKRSMRRQHRQMEREYRQYRTRVRRVYADAERNIAKEARRYSQSRF